MKFTHAVDKSWEKGDSKNRLIQHFFQVLLLRNDISNNIVIADCEPNAHVNAILEYGASETVPNWNINCGFRG